MRSILASVASLPIRPSQTHTSACHQNAQRAQIWKKALGSPRVCWRAERERRSTVYVLALIRRGEAEPVGRGYKEVRTVKVRRYTYSEKWLQTILSTLADPTLGSVTGPIFGVFLLSLALWALPEYNVLPAVPESSSEPHQLLSLSLGFLLVHRMQTAYDRFWEARTSFQALVDHLRTLARRSLIWCKDGEGGYGAQIAFHSVAMAACVREHLTFRRDISDLVVTKVLLPKEYRKLASAGNLPEACQAELTSLIVKASAAGRVSSQQAYQLEETMSDITRTLGACEKLALTPLPLEFATHTSRFLTFFCFSLPVHLVPAMGFPAVPVSTLIALSLLGIEAIGSKIEAPFTGYIPLSDLIAVFRADVQEMTRRACEDSADAASLPIAVPAAVFIAARSTEGETKGTDAAAAVAGGTRGGVGSSDGNGNGNVNGGGGGAVQQQPAGRSSEKQRVAPPATCALPRWAPQ